MKLLELRLTAFGPFSDTVLDLRGGSQGLHVVYGPNEAGKSSALRALRQLFFGIPERSADNFRHPYERMRIGGRLRGADGRELDVVRRKGRSHTLRDAQDTRPVDEAQLQALLGGADEALFRTLFALDHDELVQGGRQVVEGQGHLGEMLFAAGAGIAGLRQVQQRLQREADALFLAKGRNPRINAALAQLRQRRQELRACQLSAEQWTQIDDAWRHALERKQAVERELARCLARQRYLEQTREARPLALQRQGLLAELAPLAGTPLLRTDFGDQRRALETDLAIVVTQAEAASGRLATIQRTARDLSARSAILSHAAAIEELHRESGSLRKAQRDRERLVVEHRLRVEHAARLLHQLRPGLTLEQAEPLRRSRAEVLRIQQLGARMERYAARLESAEDEGRRLEIQVQALRLQCTEHTSPDAAAAGLRQVVARIQADGDLESELLRQRGQTQRLAEELDARLDRLTLWNGTAEALAALAVPALETVARFETDFAELEDERQRLRIQEQSQTEARHGVDRDLQRLEAEGHVPTETDLEQARARRDTGWRLVRHAARGQIPPTPRQHAEFLKHFASSELLAAFEASMAEADAIADRLRREAQRVAAKATLSAERRRLQLALDQLERLSSDNRSRHDSLYALWTSLWQPLGIVPLWPREMRLWLQQQADLAARWDALAASRRQLAELERHAQALRGHLQTLLEPGGDPGGEKSLGILLELARARIAAAEAREARQRHLNQELDRRTQERDAARQQAQAARQALEQAREQWGQLLCPLGLPPTADTAQAAAALDDLVQLFTLMDDGESLARRIAGIDRDASAFAARVAELTAVLAPQLAAAAPEAAALQLNALLGAARETEARRQEVANQQMQLQRQIHGLEQRRAELGARLQCLCAEAGCALAAELPQAEARSQRHRRLQQELDQLDQRLRELAQGAPLETLLDDALQIHPEHLARELDELREQIETLGAEKSNLDQRIGHQRAELARMDGGPQAAALEQDIQELLGRLQADSRHWMRLRLAGELLRSAVERYRQHHQGPLLERASALFAHLTAGAFDALLPDLDESGQPVLLGVRSGGERLAVAGMSEGTADQLYLALRLAGLEHWLDHGQRLPLIVDDVLVSFDDTRACAALHALAQLSRRTQVVFFTHHRHLVELAAAHLPAADLFIQELGSHAP